MSSVLENLVQELEEDYDASVRVMNTAKAKLTEAKQRLTQEKTGLNVRDVVKQNGKFYRVSSFYDMHGWIFGQQQLKDGSYSTKKEKLLFDNWEKLA
jgi:hypothetical protein